MFTSYELDPARCLARDLPLPYIRSTSSDYVTVNSTDVGALQSGDNIIPYSGTLSESISWATYDGSLIDGDENSTTPNGIGISPDGTKVYIVDANDRFITQYNLSTPFELSSSSVSGGVDLISESGFPLSVKFNDAGTKMYILDSSSDTVYQYSLSVPFDISNGDGDPGTSVDITSLTPNTSALITKSDGTVFYILDSNGTVYQFDVSTPFDPTTANLAGATSYQSTATDNSMLGMTFSTDGTKLFMTGSDNDNVYEHNLSTAFDVTTATYTGVTFSVGAQETVPWAITFNPTGTKMYIGGITQDNINEYDLSTAFDISTAVFNNVSFNLTNGDGAAYDFVFNNDGTQLFAMNPRTGRLSQYNLSTPYDVATLSDPIENIDLNEIGLDNNRGAQIYSVRFNSAGTRVFLVDDQDPVAIHVLLLTTPFDITTAEYRPNKTVTFDDVGFDVSNQDFSPYDFAFNNDGTKMFVLGINSDTVYQYTLGTPYDITTITYNNVSFDFSPQDSGPEAIAFNSRGSRMYMVSITATIYEYELTTPFDVSSASYINKTFDTGPQDLNARDIIFSPDGTKLYYSGRVTDSVYQYSINNSINGTALVAGPETPLTADPVLSAVGPDVASITYDGFRYGIEGEDATPEAIEISVDGTKMYMLGGSTDTVYQYTMSTPFDLSTADYDRKHITVRSQDVTPTGIALNPAGTKLYVVGNNNADIYQYTMSTPFDLSTATYDTLNFSVGGQEGSPRDLTFNNTGSKMYVVGDSTDSVYQFSLSTVYDVSTASYDGKSFNVNTQNAFPFSVEFNDAGTRLYVFGIQNTPTVYQYSVVTPFDVSTANSTPAASFSVANEAPSSTSMALSAGGQFMYVLDTLSNNLLEASSNPAGDAVYQYSLATSYNISTSSYDSVKKVVGGQDSPVAILFDDTGLKMFALGAYNSSIYEYALAVPFELSDSVTYTGVNFDFTSTATDLVDAIFNNDGTKLYVLKGVPANIHQFSLSTAYDITTITLDGSYDISATTGASGLAFNNNGTKLFTTNSNRIYELSVAVPYDVVGSTGISPTNLDVSPQDITARSLAFNNTGTKMYVIGDTTNTVYQYSLSPAFDLSTASYDGVSFFVGPVVDTAWSITFNNDGTKMYVIDRLRNTVKPFLLSTPYDISTAVYAVKFFSVDAQGTNPRSFAFSNNGTKMFVLDGTSDFLFQYTLSTANDVSTASYDSISYDLSVQTAASRHILFSADGTIMLLTDGNNNVIHQYSLTTAFDISTMSYDSITLDTEPQDFSPRDINFNDDGTRLYMVGYNSDTIYQYTLNTPYSISSVTYNSVFLNTAVEQDFPSVFTFNNDGSVMFLNEGSVEFIRYTLSTPYDISTATVDRLVRPGRDSFGPNYLDFTFSNDGTRLYTLGDARVLGSSGTGINQYLLNVPYEPDSAVFKLDTFSEVSGPNSMTFNNNGTKLYVSAGLGELYEYDLSTPYETGSAVYNGGTFTLTSDTETNPNGIAFNDDGSKMFITGSRVKTNAEVYQYTLTTPFDITTVSYDNVVFSMQVDDSLGGLVFNNNGTKMFIIGTGAGLIYQCELSTPYDLTTAAYNSFALNTQYDNINLFVGSQNSLMVGLAFSLDGTVLYTLGANTETGVYKYTLTQPYAITSASYSDDFYDTRPQDQAAFGFTFNNNQSKLFVVGAATSYAYQYSLTQNDVYVLEFADVGFEPLLTAIPDRSIEHTGPTGRQWDGEYVQVSYPQITGDARGIKYKFIADVGQVVNEARYDLTKTAPGIRDIRGLTP
jgi:6-phosphogluconolactonase (cycloisomerase 2 family)